MHAHTPAYIQYTEAKVKPGHTGICPSSAFHPRPALTEAQLPLCYIITHCPYTHPDSFSHSLPSPSSHSSPAYFFDVPQIT